MTNQADTSPELRPTRIPTIRTQSRKTRRNTGSYHLMLLPGIVFLFVFSVIPMFGVVIAFENFIPTQGVFHSQGIGLQNFQFMFELPDSLQIFKNTLIIACGQMVLGLTAPVVFALLLNEVRLLWYKRAVQTIVYIPHFLSWVILAGIVLEFFSLNGMINQFVGLFGVKPIMFMASNTWFRPIVIGTNTWKEFGFGTIVFLAALAGINPALYESAVIDGANRFQLLRYVTLPGIMPTIVLLATLDLGNILSTNFDQIYNLINPLVYQSGDVIDTWVYRMGLINTQYGLATAVGLLKSVVSFVLIIVSYRLAARFANYRIF